jgi:hypothetical protein
MRAWLLALLACAGFAAPAALAQNATHGLQLLQSICAQCHGFPPSGGPELAANNPNLIRAAINGLVPQMAAAVGPLGLTDSADIALEIAVLQGQAPPPPPPPPAPTLDYTDLWFNEAESGWGFNISQHSSNIIFGVMYTYGPDRKPLWYVMPQGTWSTNTTYTGPWFVVSGPSGAGATFDSTKVVATQVGTATLTFTDASHGTLQFSVNGTTVTKAMTRQSF